MKIPLKAKPEVKSESPEGVGINFKVPVEVHKRAKASASLRGQTIQEFTIEALRMAITNSEKELARAS